MSVLRNVLRSIRTEVWWTVTVLVMVTMVANVTSLSGPNVCMMKQKYNITKRVKYRAPMSVRTYEWCFAMPPRCSKWNTEMRDVTRLETEERTAEMAVCCPGYKLKDVSCVPHCPSGKTGQSCSEDCPPKKWGPSCVHDCKICERGSCDAVTGACRCHDGWQGESCETSMTTTAAAAMMEQLLTTEPTSTKTTSQTISTVSSNIMSTAATTFATNNDTASASNLTPKTTRSFLSKEITQNLPTTIATIPTTVVTSPTTRNVEESTPSVPKGSVILSNVSIPAVSISTLNPRLIETEEITKETKQATVNHSNYNRTEVPSETDKTSSSIKTLGTTEPIFVSTDVEWTTPTSGHVPTTTSAIPVHQTNTIMSTALTTTTTVKSSTPKISTTVRQQITTKLKAKEIWIKPAQKGESPMMEAKIKPNQEPSNSRPKHKEIIEITTPKTIIVSIIPTSVTYVAFKKIALTTSSLMAQKKNISTANYYNRSTEKGTTKPMIISTTSLPTTAKLLIKNKNILPTTNSSILHQNVTKTYLFIPTTRRTFRTTMPTIQTTNSMLSTLNASNKRLNSILLTTVSSFSTNVTKLRRKQHPLFDSTTSTTSSTAHFNNKISRIAETTTEQLPITKQSVPIVQKNVTNHITKLPNETFIQKQANISSNIRNVTNSKTKAIDITVTDDPTRDEETFHILTEPEHITAVMGDKRNEKSTINLISVISIAGGVMMAVITVAIIIVMLERCKKPRYEDVRKYNDIRMQVMIDNNDVPPPYVRSIFHTPLPDPPSSEKCHYQPISTLDRNLKQFMRPVVVQTISPLMLENFRGILECHYDHLPRRSQDMGTMQTRCSVAPSLDEHEELLPPPRIHSLTDSDIEAMKCEAKLDVIDNTTSEPLYAEIPCWRPPSAHAIEVVNLNGEAVTEL